MAIRKPWTVLAYMVAEDPREGPPLDRIATDEKDRILHFAEQNPERMHAAVQVDFAKKRGVLRQAQGQRAEIRNETIASDPYVVAEFLEWGISHYPGDRYLFLFWGHSFGTAGMFPDGTPGNATLVETLSLSELGFVLRGAADRIAADRRGDGEIDILLFKNCCLSTLETAYELHGSARYMIASQGLVPVKDWPYESMMPLLDDGPTDSIAAGILQELGTFYQEPENRGEQPEVPYSLIHLEDARAVAGPLENLVEKLIRMRRGGDTTGHAALLAASHGSPGDAALLDIRIMCDQLIRLGSPLDAAATDLEGTFRQLVLGCRPEASALFHGLSIFYFPGDPNLRRKSIVAPLAFAGDYQTLRLSIDTEWDRIACERMPDSELLNQSRLSTGRLAMPEGNGDPKGARFGPITDAAEQVTYDIRSLQQFLGRLSVAVSQGNTGDGVLRDFRSREGTGVRSLVRDLVNVASNLRANMEVLQSEIERESPTEARYPTDRRSSRPVRPRPSESGSRPNDHGKVMPLRDSEVRLGDLLVHVGRAG